MNKERIQEKIATVKELLGEYSFTSRLEQLEKDFMANRQTSRDKINKQIIKAKAHLAELEAKIDEKVARKSIN